MKDYRQRIRQNLLKFWKPGDDIICVGVVKKVSQVCELCGHSPITWNNILENKRTLHRISVGSKCVHNFKDEVVKLGNDVIIKYRYDFRSMAAQINKKYPGTVEIEEFSDYVKGNGDQESPNDLASEGMGMDEIDWESEDFECKE